MKLKIAVFLTVLIGFASCKNDNQAFTDITAIELKNALQKDKSIQLLDVRTPRECAGGTIEKAKEINVTADGFAEKAIAALDKSKPVYVYCRSGGRSRIASKILAENGYKVYNVDGGYMAWLDLKE